MRTKRNFYQKQNKQHKKFSIVSYTPPTKLKQKNHMTARVLSQELQICGFLFDSARTMNVPAFLPCCTADIPVTTKSQNIYLGTCLFTIPWNINDMYSNTLHLPHSLLSTSPILRYLRCFHLVEITINSLIYKFCLRS